MAEHGWAAEDKQHVQQELEARRQELSAKERSLAQAEDAAEKRWAKLTEDVSAKVACPSHHLLLEYLGRAPFVADGFAAFCAFQQPPP